MKPRAVSAAALAATALAAGAGAASAATMHPELGARLSGMGEHGIVNLRVNTSSDKLCWTFELPSSMRATGASIHAARGRAVLLELGMHFARTGCAEESAMTLEHLDAKPASYAVWVDTKGHRGELRGTLAPGMAHM